MAGNVIRNYTIIWFKSNCDNDSLPSVMYSVFQVIQIKDIESVYYIKDIYKHYFTEVITPLTLFVNILLYIFM